MGVLLFGLLLLSLLYFYLVGRRVEVGEAQAQKTKEEQRKTLTSLDKADYDFLVANGLEIDPEVHRHFYPDKGRQMAEWVEETFDPNMLTARKRQTQIAGDNSVNIQVGGSVRIAPTPERKSWINTETIRG